MLGRPRVDLEQPILRFIETRNVLEIGSLDEVAVSIVAPAVIPASEDGGRSRLLPGDRVRSMAADIVEGSYDAVFSQNQEDGKSSQLEGVVVARLCETTAVRDV